jgi:hypothetical protein
MSGKVMQTKPKPRFAQTTATAAPPPTTKELKVGKTLIAAN